MDVMGKMSNEKRLIDANALRAKCDAPHWCVWMSDIDDAPTVDAVELVRCRECFCYTPVDKNTGKCAFLIGAHQYVVPDGYCYLGERKEAADND